MQNYAYFLKMAKNLIIKHFIIHSAVSFSNNFGMFTTKLCIFADKLHKYEKTISVNIIINDCIRISVGCTGKD